MPHRKKIRARRISQALLCETPLFFFAFGVALIFLPEYLWSHGFIQVSSVLTKVFWSECFLLWGMMGYLVLYSANVKLWRLYLGSSIFVFAFIGWSCFGAGWTGFTTYNLLAFSTALKYLGLTPGLTVLRDE